jgi:MOSC domain-containing protein YiiM
MREAGRVVGIARRARPHAPMEELAAALVTPEAGVAGDHRGVARGARRRQVTLIDRTDWQAAAAETMDGAASWTLRRANLLVEGLALPRTEGTRLRLGTECVVELTGECEPCSRMDAQLLGLSDALASGWRGGRTARVLVAGRVALGDAVVAEPAPTPPPDASADHSTGGIG